MKYLVFIFSILTVFSCNNPNGNIQKNLNDDTRKVDPFLNSLVKKHPNYTNNAIVRDEATKELNKKVDSLIQRGFLTDIPLKIFNIQKNPHGKGAIVQFYTDNMLNSNNFDRLSDRFNFDIIGLMDQKLASTLNENEVYFVYGKKMKRLSETETFFIVDRVYNSTKTEITNDPIYNLYEFNVGNILCEVDSLKLVNNPQ